jgi:hypothetical protein
MKKMMHFKSTAIKKRKLPCNSQLALSLEKMVNKIYCDVSSSSMALKAFRERDSPSLSFMNLSNNFFYLPPLSARFTELLPLADSLAWLPRTAISLSNDLES